MMWKRQYKEEDHQRDVHFFLLFLINKENQIDVPIFHTSLPKEGKKRSDGKMGTSGFLFIEKEGFDLKGEQKMSSRLVRLSEKGLIVFLVLSYLILALGWRGRGRLSPTPKDPPFSRNQTGHV